MWEITLHLRFSHKGKGTLGFADGQEVEINVLIASAKKFQQYSF